MRFEWQLHNIASRWHVLQKEGTVRAVCSAWLVSAVLRSLRLRIPGIVLSGPGHCPDMKPVADCPGTQLSAVVWALQNTVHL